MDDAELISYLVDTYDMSPDRSEKIIGIPLEDDVANVSLKAMKKMMPYLEQGQLYHDAAKNAYGSHSEKDIKPLDLLPYYGELAALRPSLVADKQGMYRTMNATVHIAMNQIRAVVNDLILRLRGKPYAITIEMGRDIHAGAKERNEIDAQQTKNKKGNDRIAAELRSANIEVNRDNIQKYKLWENLNKDPMKRRCVYTDELITNITLFTPKFEVEHILPFSRTLDDSMANKTVSRVDANRFKGNRAPDQAFSDPASKWSYEDVWQRAQSLPPATAWRFNRGALDLFLKNHDCISRALNDTRHMTRMAVTYLQHICQDKYQVSGMPGRLTSLVRDAWHLNWWKNKEDTDHYRGNHIHHAIDAFVIACVRQNTFERLRVNTQQPETYLGKSVKDKHTDWFADMAVPFPEFNMVDFKMKCEDTITSYRKSIKNPAAPGTIGCLHEDTAYNLNGFDQKGGAIMSRREELPKTDKDRETFIKKDFARLPKSTLNLFLAETGYTNDTDNLAQKFLDWAASHKYKKVRLIKTDVDLRSWVPVFRTTDERDAFHRAYAAMYAADGISDGIRNKKAKKAQQEHELLLRQDYQNAAMRAYKWYIGGNNFCAEIFQVRADDTRYPKQAGKWQMEIVSNYTAQRNSGRPMWRTKYATARRVMRLRINDMVMATFDKNEPELPSGIFEDIQRQCNIEHKDTIDMIFRVKKISSNGTVFLRPHFIAKEDADTKSWGARASSLQAHQARKIHVSPTGRILE